MMGETPARIDEAIAHIGANWKKGSGAAAVDVIVLMKAVESIKPLRQYLPHLDYLAKYVAPDKWEGGHHGYMACDERAETGAGPCQFCMIRSILEHLHRVMGKEVDDE